MINALIVDDEKLARRGLILRLEAYPEMTICGVCNNGREAIAAVFNLKPDIVFLDVQMPGVDGFEVVKAISGPNMPLIVFVTAYDQHALRAFEVNALDYLLKPIVDERLAEVILRIKEALNQKESQYYQSKLLDVVCKLRGESMTLEDALATAPETSPVNYLIVNGSGDKRKIAFDDIDWIESARDYVCIRAKEQTYVLRETMKDIEGLLKCSHFLRIHRSTMINQNKITAFRKNDQGQYRICVKDTKEFNVGRSYRKKVAQVLRQYQSRRI